MRRSIYKLGISAAVAIAGLSAASRSQADIVYDSIPNGTIYSLPSEAYAATGTSEFGDEIGLDGTSRQLTTVTIGMDTWATQADFSSYGNSQGYYVPLTLNIYSVNGGTTPTAGTLLATDTVNTFVPWRPAADRSDGRWTDPDGNAHSGLYFSADFDLASLDVTLPDDVIVTVALNTGSYGADPTGNNSAPYDSLNFALGGGEPNIGTDVNQDAVFQNQAASNGGTGTLVETSGYSGSIPTIEVNAITAPEPGTYALLGGGLLMAVLVARRPRSRQL